MNFEHLDLTACYPCEECNGSGDSGHVLISGYEKCPTCKGTGKGSPMVAILAEDQEPPKLSSDGICLVGAGQYEAIKVMTTPKDGTVWKKVKV